MDAGTLSCAQMPASPNRDWDTYFLGLARQAATRSNCVKEKHGAVIVSKRRIRSTGYNGPPTGYGHCDDGACPMGRAVQSGDGDDDGRGQVCFGLHAAANAILYASPDEREGATIYLSSVPCIECAKLIANSGLKEIVAVGDGRRKDLDLVREFLLDCKVRIRVLKAVPEASPQS
jgi:dCMP deaminase